MNSPPLAPTAIPSQSGATEKKPGFWPQGWWKLMEFRIGILPLPVYLVLLAIIVWFAQAGGKFPGEICMMIAVLAVGGFACGELGKQDKPDFSAVSEGPFDIDVNSLPKGPFNILDLESAIEIYTPLYQLFLTDSDFWRACNSLQLDETVAIYTARIIGDSGPVSLVNNKHPLVPLSTLRAGYRLLLHGLAAESLHANLAALKRRTKTSSAV